MLNSSSGSNSRVIEVMNFLAQHPTESFTLSEIASHLGLSNGSAHRVLTVLAESQYLSRHPKRKTYSLGMALVAIGQAALAQHRNVDVARRWIAKLAGDLEGQWMVSTVADGELLVLACEGSPRTAEPPNQIGERRPFIPPLGMGHVAWADASTQTDYLERAPAALTPATRRRLEQSLRSMRQRGYGIAGSGTAIRALRTFTHLPVGSQATEPFWSGLRQLLSDLSEREIQLLDLDEANSGGVAYITAPVFSPAGEVLLELSVSGLPIHLRRADIESYVARLCAAAAAVTAETHGRFPHAHDKAPSARTARTSQ
jgi:DNA-binding IclR family transcriptional regulator